MRVLVINGDCITTNTSANLCHLAYIRGLLGYGAEVTLLCADDRYYDTDPSMKIPEDVTVCRYDGMTLYERLSIKKHSSNKPVNITPIRINDSVSEKRNHKNLRRIIKDTVLSLYGIHGTYSKFIKTVSKYKDPGEFDYILSLSTPVTSHIAAYNLIQSGNVKTKKWIQIWEDPWYSDAYGFNNRKEVFEEEKRILGLAEYICYVSPLTLRNQQALFPESAEKMYWQPVPCYYSGENSDLNWNENRYGYFGDYTPVARDLSKFYESAVNEKIHLTICGNPYGIFSSTDEIDIHPRMTLQELKPIEDKTNILVFLCNRAGGQIPGKIYQYSMTNKTILFILDGTEEEKTVLYDFFSKYNRYVFCENTVESITEAIHKIEKGDLTETINKPVADFYPKLTIEKILKGCEGNYEE